MAYKISKIEHLSKCVHYCDIGGHLWHHMTETKRCQWKTPEGKVKFFSICPDHRPKYEEDNGY